jgi:hypothetical protein
MRRFFILLGIIVPLPAFAGVSITSYGWSCQGFLKCGSSTDAVTDLTMNIINGVTSSLAAVAVVAIFYGALRMVTSRGEEGKEAGKKALIYALLGLAAAMLTGAILSYVSDYIYAIG